MSDKVFTWNAFDYSKHSLGQQTWARELISKLALKGDESVLDIGCGDGKVTAEIADMLPSGSVLGIDYSNEMISLAKEKFSSNNYPNLNFILEDACNLDFKSQFDIVFSNAALHWVKNHLSVLTGIYNALKPGGKFLLQMGGKGNAADLVKIVTNFMNRDEWKDYFNGFEFPYGFYSPQEYKPWLNTSGLTAERIELVPKDMVHDSPQEFEGWIRTTWFPFLDRIPEKYKKIFTSNILDAYLEQSPPDNMGKIHIKMIRLEVQGKK